MNTDEIRAKYAPVATRFGEKVHLTYNPNGTYLFCGARFAGMVAVERVGDRAMCSKCFGRPGSPLRKAFGS